MLVRISGLSNFQITGATNIDGGSLFPSPPTAAGWVGKLMATGFSGYNPVDAVLKIRYQYLQHRAPPFYYRPLYASATSGKIIYPFVSRAFTITNGSSLTLTNPVNLKIELFQAKGAYDSHDSALSSSTYAPGSPTYDTITSDPTNLIQTINVTFPVGSFPQPTLPTANTMTGINTVPPGSTPYAPYAAWGFDGKIASVDGPTGGLQASAMIGQSGSAVYDTVRTVSVLNGDVRAIAAMKSVDNLPPRVLYGLTPAASSSYNSTSTQSYHFFTDNAIPGGYQSGKIVPGIGSVGITNNYPSGTDTFCLYGDWDGPVIRSGGVTINNGAYINKPDEGDNADPGTGGTSGIPYYGYGESTTKNASLYTPNRLMPSAGMFGSLPTGVKRNQPWQTLLFRPQAGHPNASVPAASPATEPPFNTIPDHLLMDLFWMPVVEPYAISEVLSTAGKINLNYQIAPFTYITRATGMYSLLKSEKMAARPITLENATATTNFRLSINPSEINGTLSQFTSKFGAGNIFRSATEICDMDLVPTLDPSGVAQSWSPGWAGNFWQANANTGDNVRERPYTNLYARLTTKSNTYTVHFRVQTLQKNAGTDAATWVEGRDQVVSEYRGSSELERYLDAGDTTLPDFETNPSDLTTTLGSHYKFRVVSTKKFAP